ncbi:MAG: hypothetical protein PUB34_06815 [Clostridia bacterium]|nr:hypothetical protein [Clostridia bacterium]
MKTFKRILAVALSAFLIVPTMLTGLSVSAADVGYERSWDVVTSGGTVSVDNGALVAENTGAYATTKFITKSASTMDGFKANVLTNSDTITFALTTARDNYDELSEFACASDKTQGMERFGIVRATNLAAGEHTFNVTLSEFLDLGWYTYPGTLGDGIYDQAVFSVVHNGEHWDSSNNEIISLGIKQGEAFDFEMINHYDEDEAANIFGYSLNGTPVWPRTGGFDNYNDLDYYFVVMAYSINASSGNADLTVNTVCGVPAAEFKPELPKVAVIGDAAYTSLAEAYEAAVAGDTITLIGDVALDSVLNVEKDLTLDLGNYTITAAGNALRVSGANVVINAVNGGITAGEGGSYYAVCAVADALVTINGGNYTVGADENGEGNNTIYAAASNGVAGHIVINGGTFSSAATYAGKYWVLNGQDRTGATITVNGGKFVNFEPGVTVVAPEGTEEIILNPKATVTEADGVYTVKVVVAKIGDVEYKSLAEAYEAAVAGDTITLVANEDLTDVLLIEKNLTLDLGNYTITAAGNALRVRGANVTINAVNGGVTGGEGGSYCAVRSEAGALVTINGGNYTVGADENGEGNNTIYAATYSEDPDKVPGHVVINDGTFSTAATYDEKYWVLNCQDRTGATITVNGGKFVNFEPGVTVVAPEGTEEILLGACAAVTAEENVYTVAIKHTNTGALTVVNHAIVSDVCSVCGTVIQEAPAYDKFIIDGNPGTTAAFDENGDVTLTGTITKFVSKNTYEMNGITIKANSTAPNAAFTITTTPSSYDDWAEWSQLTIGAGYGYYGNLTGNWTAGEYSLNITLSDFLDLGWTVLGTKDDNTYNVGTATICSNGNFWGDKSKTDFAVPMGEDFTLTVHNYYNEDDAGWELSYDVNGVYHYPDGMANAYKDANFKDYTIIAGANFTTLCVKEMTGLNHECDLTPKLVNHVIVSECSVCGAKGDIPAYDKFILDGNPGTTAAFDENGDVTLTGTITKFITKNTFEMNGLTIKANSTAPNAAFTITTTPSSYDDWAEWSQLKIGAGYGYYGNLTGNWTAGEYSLNITLSDALDLGWTVLGTANDNIYNVGTATVCSNGNFWGDKSKTDFAIPMGEDFTLTVHNYYNEDDAGWELSYDVNGVYHYPDGMANAFKDANFKDYTVIAGANFTTLSVKEVTGLKHTCVGAENTAYNSEVVCTICGKVIGYTPSLAADEKLITVSTADEIKDIFFIEGTYADYAEIKAAHASDASLFYTRRVGGTDKIVDGTTVVNTTKYGTFTVLTRLADGRSFIDTVEMVAPAAAENTIVVEGSNANVTNNYGANFVMVFEGHYDTYAEAKAAKTTAPYFKSYSATKVNADGSYDVVLPAYGTEYTVVVRTLTGEYVLSYVQTEAKPAVVFDGLTFTGLENVTTVRYAKGTYTNVSDMKTSTEYRGIASRLFVDNTFTLKTALKGEYTIVYQYANGAMDIFTLTF